MYQNSLNGLFSGQLSDQKANPQNKGVYTEQDICSQNSCWQMFPKLISERTPYLLDLPKQFQNHFGFPASH